jgi:hypothetical protein
MKDTTGTTLCIGVDVTWWGGGGALASRRDTVVAALLGDGVPGPLHIEPVFLSGAPNSQASLPTEPNFDKDGQLLTDAIGRLLSTYKGRYERCVVALDAPLEARARPGQPTRRKAVPKGARMFSERRACEDALSQHMTVNPGHASWNTHVKIQSGSPIAPRISRICERLCTNSGFTLFRQGATQSANRLIEIFPSEAIWALGSQGHYGAVTSTQVRAYKAKQPRRLGHADALDCARRPLQGFVNLTRGARSVDLVSAIPNWVEQVAEHSCAIAASSRESGQVDKGKGYDDPIESGLAFFTALVFTVGQYHVWGDGADGTIVGPGRFQPEAVR